MRVRRTAAETHRQPKRLDAGDVQPREPAQRLVAPRAGARALRAPTEEALRRDASDLCARRAAIVASTAAVAESRARPQPSPKRDPGARRRRWNAAARPDHAEARCPTQPTATSPLARRHRRARRCAAADSPAEGAGAASSTICVRHQRPPSSRSGSCATRPAPSRSSSHRCTLRRCARTKRARPTRPRGTGPHPITGASPTTSCAIDVAYRADRAAWPSRNR